jgi:anti-anti-sigma factor
MPLSLESRFIENVFVIECKGQIVHGPEVKSFEACLQMGEREFKRLVVAIGEVSKLDSIGLGLLVRNVDSLRKRGGDLRLANPPAFVSHLLDMTKLSTFLPTYATEDDAVVSFLTQTIADWPADSPGHRVLIIDQSPDLGAFARAILTQHGYQVRSAALISDAKMLLRFQTADFILFGPGTPEAAVESGTAALRSLAPRAVTVALPGDLRTVDAHEAARVLLGLFQTTSSV